MNAAGVEHANFFETRATEYSKAATRGNWNEVWENFDRRVKAKAAAANDGEGEDAVETGLVGRDRFGFHNCPSAQRSTDFWA